MVDPKKWGKKFICFKCGCKFYDLNKPRPVCPKCGADQSERRPQEEEVEFDDDVFDEDRLPVADDDEVADVAEDIDEEMPPMQEDLGYDESEPEEPEED